MAGFSQFDLWLTTDPAEKDELAWEEYCDAALSNENLEKLAQACLDNEWLIPDTWEERLALLRKAELFPSFDAWRYRIVTG